MLGTMKPLDYPTEGQQVRLVCCNDPYTELRPGAIGTVMFVDPLGTLHVRWDSGSTLGLLYVDGDRWEVLPCA